MSQGVKTVDNATPRTRRVDKARRKVVRSGLDFAQTIDIHVRYMSVIIGIDRKKIGIYRLDVFCGRSGEHHFEGLEALSIFLECKYLSLVLHKSAISRSSEEKYWDAGEAYYLRCEVLFPGAAVASITCISAPVGGESTNAGKHEALSWSMTFPVENSSSSWSCISGGNASKSVTYLSS